MWFETESNAGRTIRCNDDLVLVVIQLTLQYGGVAGMQTGGQTVSLGYIISVHGGMITRRLRGNASTHVRL